MHKLDIGDIIDHNPREILAAVPDALSLTLGAGVRAPHPFADAVAAAPLRTAAIAAGLLNGTRLSGETEAAVLGRGIRTTQFAGAVSAGFQGAARRSFDEQAAHLGAVARVEVQRLGVAESVGALDLAAPLENVGDGLQFKVSSATLRDGEAVTLSSIGRIITVSRQVIFNDELDLIRDRIAATGTGAARHEARLVAAALEANPTLSDGGVVFGAAYGNVVATAFGDAGLGEAMGALRTMVAADGSALDAQAVSLIVAPALEFTARQLVFLTGLPLAVLVLPGLAAGRYYVAASPSVARNIVVGRLDGQSHPLAVEGVKAPLSYDGAAVRVRIDTASAMIGRVGIVRGGA